MGKMANNFRNQLNTFYRKNGIHPEDFHCQFQNTCRMAAFNGNMTETKMSMVGSHYGDRYPKIIVISLDPPSGEDKDGKIKRWDFKAPEHRTTDYVSSIHEKDDYLLLPPNQHWKMTQVIVKDLLVLFGFPSKPNSAVASASFAGRPIENVSSYFAHINMAKCSMNRPDQGEAPASVHKRCSSTYLPGELALLEPDIIVSQGDPTNRILGKMFIDKKIFTKDLPLVEKILLTDKNPIWMPMIHPARQFGKVQASWPEYVSRLQKLM
jgi:hypothetical protein